MWNCSYNFRSTALSKHLRDTTPQLLFSPPLEGDIPSLTPVDDVMNSPAMLDWTGPDDNVTSKRSPTQRSFVLFPQSLISSIKVLNICFAYLVNKNKQHFPVFINLPIKIIAILLIMNNNDDDDYYY